MTEAEYNNGIKTACDKENKFFEKELGKEFCDKKISFSDPLSYEEIRKYLEKYSDFQVPEVEADAFRDLALKIENSALECAYDLMRIAHIIRPEGPFISKKLEEYYKKLNLN